LLFGVGYDGIAAALRLPKGAGVDLSLGAGMTFGALVLLAFMKVFATSTTLAGGGSGGVFAPSIFLGAVVGGAYGLLANKVFPGFTAPPGAYVLVGMGALFAGTAHAPITSVLILFEMTDDYKIILPLMIAVVISHLISSVLSPDSIYTIKLRRRGGLNGGKARASVLDLILVADAMDTDFETVLFDEPVEELAKKFHGSHRRGFGVVDEEDRLTGIVTEYDLETALMAGDAEGKRAGDIMTREPITCTPDQPLREVLGEFTTRDVGHIPVVRRDDPGKLLGVLRRREIIWAYGQMATEHRRLLEASELPAERQDSVLVELEVRAPHKKLSFKKVREIRVPDQCLIVMMRRADRAVIPRGDTVVEPGDVLVLLATRSREDRLRTWVEEVTRH
jgi:CIC family chloride channel protein